MRVLHLPYGGQMVTLCAALRNIGVEAMSCHFERSNFNFKPDLCLDLQNVPPSKKHFVKQHFFQCALSQFDVFHFHFGLTFFDDHSDLEILRKLGKKVIVQHRGSDVRRLSIARNAGNRYVQVKYPDERKIISKLYKLSKYIDHAIVADYELLPYIEGFYNKIHIIRQAIDLNKFVPAYHKGHAKAPLLLHAPSHSVVKGTSYVKNAVWHLRRNGYPFEFQLLRKVPHEEAVRLYRQADVIIDQMCIGSFGVLSLEGMALGKPVICFIRDELLSTYPEGLPIINADPNTIYKNLRDLLANPEQFAVIGGQGRSYVEKHHDSLQIAEQLENIYRQL